MQDEFYAIAFRKNVYDDLEQLQQDLDVWMEDYNTVRTHSGKYGYGKTPMQTFEEAKHLGMQKQLDPLETARSSLGKYSSRATASRSGIWPTRRCNSSARATRRWRPWAR